MNQPTTSPKAKIALEILGLLKPFYSSIEAQKWLMSGQDVFGGKSAVMMIKEGREAEVRQAIARMETGAFT